MKEVPHISIVSPVYKAEKILEKLVDEIQRVMCQMNVTYEIILVDDRSPDNSWEVMQQLSSKFSEVKSLRLSRNFGQHPTIMAGLSEAKGEWIVVMDCDLQDQPKEIVKIYNKAIEGFDIVLARRENRKDGFFKKLASKIYTIIFNYLADIHFNNEIANFGIYNKKVIDAVLQIGDHIKAFPLFVNHVGYQSTSIAVEHADRYSGTSSYSLSKSMSLAFNAIISYSNKPLKIFVKFGMLISFLAFIGGIINIYLYLEDRIKVSGYSSIIISLWFLSGIIITVVGVVGIYVGKVFEQTKNRPTYIIDKIIKN
ncbi:glycosyltransferase family 2 protein [Flavobacterium myungsuense]|uniref:Glycosyltransferase family 2 protein n=1 Tax=Flavobacterium myungsuense TaxID=651823 RepID=A0ABW3J1N1_9FLAO